MAARIVLLGWSGECVEVDSPDAGMLIASGMCRPSLTKWGGELADATVLQFRPEYLAAHGGAESERAHRAALVRAIDLLEPSIRPFHVGMPLPVGGR